MLLFLLHLTVKYGSPLVAKLIPIMDEVSASIWGILISIIFVLVVAF